MAKHVPFYVPCFVSRLCCELIRVGASCVASERFVPFPCRLAFQRKLSALRSSSSWCRHVSVLSERGQCWFAFTCWQWTSIAKLNENGEKASAKCEQESREVHFVQQEFRWPFWPPAAHAKSHGPLRLLVRSLQTGLHLFHQLQQTSANCPQLHPWLARWKEQASFQIKRRAFQVCIEITVGVPFALQQSCCVY